MSMSGSKRKWDVDYALLALLNLVIGIVCSFTMVGNPYWAWLLPVNLLSYLAAGLLAYHSATWWKER